MKHYATTTYAILVIHTLTWTTSALAQNQRQPQRSQRPTTSIGSQRPTTNTANRCNDNALRDLRQLQSLLGYLINVAVRPLAQNTTRDLAIRGACEALKSDLTTTALLGATGRQNSSDRVRQLSDITSPRVRSIIDGISRNASATDCNHVAGRLGAEALQGLVSALGSAVIGSAIGARIGGPIGALAGVAAGGGIGLRQHNENMNQANESGDVAVVPSTLPNGHPEDMYGIIYRSQEYFLALRQQNIGPYNQLLSICRANELALRRQACAELNECPGGRNPFRIVPAPIWSPPAPSPQPVPAAPQGTNPVD